MLKRFVSIAANNSQSKVSLCDKLSQRVGYHLSKNCTSSFAASGLTTSTVRFFAVQRGYKNTRGDMPWELFHETNCALMGSRNAEDFAKVFIKYQDYLTDYHIAYAYGFIADNNLDLDEHFWKTILPVVKNQLKFLDKYCHLSYTRILTATGKLQIQDNELWELLEHKFVNERLHRYLTLEELVTGLQAFVYANRATPVLFEIVERTLIKHRKALTPQLTEGARSVFLFANKGSEALHTALEYPDRMLPQIE